MNFGRRDIVPLLKFAAIGVVNTALHSVCVIFLHSTLAVPVLASHFVAFWLVNAFSYMVNSHFVFHANPRLGSYLRFVAVSLFSLAATLLIAGICEFAGLDYSIGLAAVIFIAPPVTYALQRSFTFRSG